MTEQYAGEIHDLKHPEEGEVFAGQKVLVIGGSDAHGVSMAVESAEYLSEKGAEAHIFVGSPVIRKGAIATHPGAFWDKALPNISLEGIDRVVIADISLNFKNLERSERSLIDLVGRLDDERKRRNLPPLEHPVIFLDHHRTSRFTPAWKAEDGEEQPPLNVASHGVLIKSMDHAYDVRLGQKPSLIARIGAIADRDPKTLPVTPDEMLLARGLDVAIRPDLDDPKPVEKESLALWEDRVQVRLEETVRRLQAADWDYFRAEALRVPKLEIPMATGFGQVTIVDTQDKTMGFSVLKTMEAALEMLGPENMPYAVAVLRDQGDPKMDRPTADLVTIIRHWTREDLPSVEEVLLQHCGSDVLDLHQIYGPANAKTMRLPVSDRETARFVAQLVEAFGGSELPDFSNVKSVVMCGDPNSGKSVFSTILREALKTLGVRVRHLDLDKAAPTPQWYLNAEIAYKEAELLLAKGKITDAQLAEKKQQLEEAAAKRKALKRPWSIDLAEEAKLELMAASLDENTEFVIGDIGGGRITKDPETGKIVKIQRLTAENARILEGADAVIIVSNNPQGMREWQQLIESGVDPETGIRINRDKPIKIIGMYQSILEGTVQKVTGNGHEAGVITNLDRALAQRTYNPSIFTTALFISEAVEKRREGGSL